MTISCRIEKMYNNSLSIKLYVKQINKQVKKRFAVMVKEEKIMLPSGDGKAFLLE